MKNNIPERINVEKDSLDKYRNLKGKLGKKFTNADIFTLAMIYGYIHHVRVPLKRKHGFFRTISARDNFFTLMIMLFINEKNLIPSKLDQNLANIFYIAEEYANGGLEILEKDMYKYEFDFNNKLASDILKFNSQYKIVDTLNDWGIE